MHRTLMCDACTCRSATFLPGFLKDARLLKTHREIAEGVERIFEVVRATERGNEGKFEQSP